MDATKGVANIYQQAVRYPHRINLEPAEVFRFSFLVTTLHYDAISVFPTGLPTL
jgi:hypothetical protein